jgi:IMP dehydrogenase
MKKYSISGVPITEDGSKEGRLVGILTNRDLRFETNVSRAISEVMTREPLFTVPVGTTLDAAREILHRHKVEKLLVVDRDFRLKGLITVKDIQKGETPQRAGRLGLGRGRMVARRMTAPRPVAARTPRAGSHAHGHSQGVRHGRRIRRSSPIDLCRNAATGDATSADQARRRRRQPASAPLDRTTRIIAGIGAR